MPDGEGELRHWKAQEQGLWSPEDNRVFCKDAQYGSSVVDRRQAGKGWPEQGFGNVGNQEAGTEWVASKEAAGQDGKEEDEEEEGQESRPSLGHCWDAHLGLTSGLLSVELWGWSPRQEF